LYEAKVVKQVLSYLRFLLNPKDEMAFDVIAKHQKLPKSFSGPWKAYRGKVWKDFFDVLKNLLFTVCNRIRRLLLCKDLLQIDRLC
jgi:hypothetical protein